VAVLAGDPFLPGRRGAVLLPDRLQLDAGMDGHLMAGDAELRLLECGGLDGRLVDADPFFPVGLGGAVGLVGADQDPQGHGIADGLDAAGGVEGTEDRLVDVAGRDPARAVDLAVALAGTVAGDAGDAFAGSRAAVPPGDVAPLPQRRT